MKYNLYRFIFFACFYFLSFASVFSQQSDNLGDLSILKIKNDSALIYLENVSIEVEIIGNRATTVTTLTFYNPNDRILEGELNFPLADKQRVFRFAMDLNGKLREGVVVEKELGRRAFEGTVRQEIDPALLEMTVGNNYKARVYPIPAKGRKIILIGYEEELQDSKAPLYQLNLKYGKVKEFDLKVEVVSQTEKPIIKENQLSNFDFEKWKTSYIANSKKENFEATGVFSFEIPTQINEQVFREKSNSENTENDYFYINLIPNVIQKEKEMPSSMAVLWDVSVSSKERNTEKEIALLQNYLKEISQKQSTTSSNSLKVKLILFNNRIVSQNDFLINESNFEKQITKITNQLENIVYDGGTDLKAIDFPKLEQEEILLFSDGISNLSYAEDAFPIKKDNLQTIYTIVSSGTNDAPFLNSLAQKTGGNYINLSSETQNEAIEALLSQNYQFLGAKYENKIISEVYPIIPQTVQKGKTFSLAGQINSAQNIDKDSEIEIQFGIGKEVLDTRKITIPKNYNSESSESIRRMWANKKVAQLSLNATQNKSKIIEVAKKYSLITPYTSLIVLDRVEDYVRYEISPPAELKKEYDELIAQKTKKIVSTETEIIQNALSSYQERVSWWTENKKAAKPIKKKKQTHNSQNNNQHRRQNREIPIDEDEVQNYERNRTITGIVSEIGYGGLPGASVQIKGTTTGTTTDLEGRYSLVCSPEDVIVYRFVGFDSEEIRVGNRTQIDVNLQEDSQLSEVVVTSYGATEETEEEIEEEIEILDNNVESIQSEEIIQSLQGKAAGVQISSNGVAGSSSQIVIRGNSSVNSNSNEYLLLDSTQTQSTIQQERTTKLIIKKWSPNEPYMDSIKNASKKNRFQTYLSLKKEYSSTPSFFLIVGTYFIQNGEQEIGLQILSNLVELELENHELLKMLGYKYSELGKMETAIFLFEKVKELRPDEPHSTRDLALAYQKNGEYQKALDLFYQILITDFSEPTSNRNALQNLFPNFKSIVLTEFNNLIALHEDKLDLSKVKMSNKLHEKSAKNEKENQATLIKNLPVDVRVVLDWNTLETDIDLWLIEPTGEKCYYQHKLTQNGGRMSNDMTNGYGSEEYLLKEAMKGEYIIKVHFYGDRVQKIAGATTLKATIYFNYGSKNQTQKEIVFQLEAGQTGQKELEIGRFEWVK